MSEGSPLETLRFELEAAKQVLVSQNGILAANRRGYHHAVNTNEHELRIAAFECLIREYEQASIPRTERMIEALTWAVEQLS